MSKPKPKPKSRRKKSGSNRPKLFKFKLSDDDKTIIKKFCDDRIERRVVLLKAIHKLVTERDTLKKKLETMLKITVGHPDQKELENSIDRIKIQHMFKEKEFEATADTYCRLDAQVELEAACQSATGKQRKHFKTKINVIINAVSKYQEIVDLENAKVSSKKKYLEMVAKLTKLASKMWADVKKKVVDDPKFIDVPDKEKLTYFREELKYEEFMNEYPVMTRYMVCMGQYSSKAFKRYLEKVRNTVPPVPCPPGYKEDQWVRRQADYVQFLWEAYQRNHIDSAERKMVWSDAYKNLKGEFDDFRDKYKAVEAATKEEKGVLKAKNARDLIKRLSGGQQALTDDETRALIKSLRAKVVKSKYRKTLKQLKATTTEIEAVSFGRGRGPAEEDEKNKPRVIMTEHVNADADHIPDALLKGIDAEDVSKYTL